MNFRIVTLLCLALAVVLSILFGIEGKVSFGVGTGIAVSLTIFLFFIAGYFIGRKDGEKIAKK